MGARSLADALAWAEHGAALVTKVLESQDEATYAAPSALPGWTRKHVVAHLAANATAVGHLLHWAETGEPTPMYSSPEQRNADIDSGSQLPGSALSAWFAETDDRLRSSLATLPEAAWSAQVVTAQGRTVPASEVPWMRAREVMVHAVDLGAGVGFEDLPSTFLVALGDDIVHKRGAASVGPALTLHVPDQAQEWTVAGDGEPVVVVGELPEVVAYLAGRVDPGGRAAQLDAPPLPAWL